MNRTDERTAAHVRQQLEDSLRALQTDYIDLYQFHSVADPEFDDEELRRALEDMLASGKVRHVGNSVRAKGDPMHQIERSAGGEGRGDPDRLQPAHRASRSRRRCRVPAA